jgi:nucleoside-diphosphate-sugar epimerase
MRVLVTGGGGFLGSHIARQLVARGHRVAVLGRHPYPGLDEGIECIQADICDSNAVNRALKGREAVFHAAAMAGIWGRPKDFYSINVEGTDNIIAGCVQNSVSKLIFTSSPSVVFGQSDMENVDESAPYPEVHLSQYSRTKALAERRVLQMNGHNGLMTVALRPHLIWGVGDPHLIPRVIERAKKGRLLRVGQGGNRVDLTHVENAAHAHVLACEAMEASSPIAGKCYFVSDDRPVDLWKWIDELLSALTGESRSGEQPP